MLVLHVPTGRRRRAPPRLAVIDGGARQCSSPPPLLVLVRPDQAFPAVPTLVPPGPWRRLRRPLLALSALLVLGLAVALTVLFLSASRSAGRHRATTLSAAGDCAVDLQAGWACQGTGTGSFVYYPDDSTGSSGTGSASPAATPGLARDVAGAGPVVQSGPIGAEATPGGCPARLPAGWACQRLAGGTYVAYPDDWGSSSPPAGVTSQLGGSPPSGPAP